MSVSRRTTLKAIGIAGGLGIATGSVFAKGTHEDDERPADGTEELADVTAAVRVAHFSPDAPNVDVLVDGDQVLADVAFGDVSPYLELEPGTYTVAITAAGDPEAVVFEDELAVGEGFATIAAIGELEAETFRPEILLDAEPLPEDAEPDAAFVRVAHFSPDAPAVDIFADDAPLVENVSFEDVSEYLAVPAGEYTLSIRPAGEPDEVAAFDVALEEGTPYTGYAIGYLEPPEEFADREFTVELTVDGEMAAEVPENEDPKEPRDEKEPVDKEPEKKEPVDGDPKEEQPKDAVDEKKEMVDEKKRMADEMVDEKKGMADEMAGMKAEMADEKSVADAAKKMATDYDC